MAIVKPRKIKPYSGYSNKTADRMLLDAGAFFANYDPATHTYASAKKAGKCLGVTIKGGEFSAKPTLRRLEFDGVKTRTKGDTVVDGWEVYIKATLAEMTTQNFIYGLGIADKGTDEKVVGYDVITGRDVILDGDYIKNITWVGCLLGEDKPCIIQVFNGFNENGLTLAIADKDNGKVEAQFYGNLSPEVYNSEDEIKPPFKIFRPTEKTETTETSEA